MSSKGFPLAVAFYIDDKHYQTVMNAVKETNGRHANNPIHTGYRVGFHIGFDRTSDYTAFNEMIDPLCDHHQEDKKPKFWEKVLDCIPTFTKKSHKYDYKYDHDDYNYY